jgi:hypothetical protein
MNKVAVPVPMRGWSRRTAEWTLLIGLVLALIWLFSGQIREVQGQAEAAAVKSTLGALRVAFVINQVQTSLTSTGAGAQTDTSKQRNPFELLQSRPLNYFGEIPAVEGSQAPPGSWSFNAECDCIAYQPVDDRWFYSPSGDTTAFFKIVGSGGSPLQLAAKEVYLWRGQVLD